jgi:metal-responsive CopG/Arc/MetJ family transcriptional regulator
MFGPKIKIDRELYGKLKEIAEERGYSSAEEFVTHILEREVSKGGGGGKQDEEEIKKKLEGLGYL